MKEAKKSLSKFPPPINSSEWKRQEKREKILWGIITGAIFIGGIFFFYILPYFSLNAFEKGFNILTLLISPILIIVFLIGPFLLMTVMIAHFWEINKNKPLKEVIMDILALLFFFGLLIYVILKVLLKHFI